MRSKIKGYKTVLEGMDIWLCKECYEIHAIFKSLKEDYNENKLDCLNFKTNERKIQW